MSSKQDSENYPPIKRGVYKPPLPGDLRSPCPIVNSLANHGYISRDGCSIRASEMKSAIHELGISSTISTTLTYGAYLVHHENPPTGWWPVITNPFRSALQKFALRSADDYDAAGYPVLQINYRLKTEIQESQNSSKAEINRSNAIPKKKYLTKIVKNLAFRITCRL